MSEPLTPIERRVYHYMIDFLAENTYQPSIREIARKFRIKSTKTVSDLLHALEHKGFIERDESRSRGVRLIGFAGGAGVQPVPYYGAVQNGDPALVAEHRKGFVTLDRRFLPNEHVFMLKVKDASMTGRGILGGDYVMVDAAAQPKDGDVVAARIGGDVTVKAFARRGANGVLEPANDSEQPVEITPNEDFAILGVVCGVFRPYWEAEPEPSPVTPDEAPTTAAVV